MANGKFTTALFFLIGLDIWCCSSGIVSSSGCQNSARLTDSYTETPVGGNVQFRYASKNSIQNGLVYRLCKNDPIRILSVNSNGPPINHSSWYQNRTAIMRSPDMKVFTINISNIQFSDGGTYCVLWKAMHHSKTECYTVYVLGKPTIPEISVIEKSSGLAWFYCSSNSTSTPKTHQWRLRYFFKVNNVDINPDSDSDEFVVKGNKLITAKGSLEGKTLEITCTVQEDNSQPTNVTSAKAFPGHHTNEKTNISQRSTSYGTGDGSAQVHICSSSLAICCLFLSWLFL